MAYREDLFLHTVKSLNAGRVQAELSEKLNQLVQDCRSTCNKGKIQLTIEITPDKAGSGQYVLKENVKVTPPSFPRTSTFLWGTPEGNLQAHDPAQGHLDLKTMNQVQQEAKTVETPHVAAKSL